MTNFKRKSQFKFTECYSPSSPDLNANFIGSTDSELINKFLKKASVAALQDPNIVLNNQNVDTNIINNIYETKVENEWEKLNANVQSNNMQQQNHSSQTTINNTNLINNDDLNEPKAAAYSYLKYYFVSMLQPSDNKLAMKLFGSKKGVLKEKLRQQEVGHWIIHPCSNFRYTILLLNAVV